MFKAEAKKNIDRTDLGVFQKLVLKSTAAFLQKNMFSTKKNFKENLKGRDSNSTFPHKAFSTFANYIPSGPKPQTFRHISAAFYRQKKLNNEPKNVMWETRTSYFCFSFLSRKHANYF